MKSPDPRRLPTAVLVPALAALLAAPACDDQSGVGGDTTFEVPAGEYDVHTVVTGCETTDTLTFMEQHRVSCRSDEAETLFGIEGCPIVRHGSGLSVNCTITQPIDSFCQATLHLRGDGTTAASRSELSGQLEWTDDPPGCAPSFPPCARFSIELVKVGGPPSTCDYADANTIAATITGGPYAGPRVFGAVGYSNGEGEVHFQFLIHARYPNTKNDDPNVELIVAVPSLGVADLPAVLPIIPDVGTGESPEDSVRVLEYTERNESYLFTASSVTGGSFTVNEIAVDRIAGSFTMDFGGIETTDTGDLPANRTVEGRYFVLDELRSPTLSALLARLAHTLAARTSNRP